MDTEEISLVHSCRLCLKMINEDNLKVSIFEDNLQNSVIPLKIITCVQIEVNESDPFPRYICLDCENNLNIVCAFKQTCTIADSKLKQYFSMNASLNEVNDSTELECSKNDFDNTTNTLASVNVDQIVKVKTEPEQVDCPMEYFEMMEPETLLEEYDQEECHLEANKITKHMHMNDINGLTHEETGIGTRDPLSLVDFPLQTEDNMYTSTDSQAFNTVKLEPVDLVAEYFSDYDAKSPDSDCPLDAPDASQDTELTTNKTIDCTSRVSHVDELQLVDDAPLARYTQRKIIDVNDGKFIYTNNNHTLKPTFKRGKRMCKTCNKTFRKECDLKAHQKFHALFNTKKFKSQKHMNDQNLRRQYKVSKKPDIWACSLCETVFSGKADFIAHNVKTHASKSTNLPSQKKAVKVKPTFPCAHCDVIFEEKGALICHQAYYHRVEINRNVGKAISFRCEVCQKTFQQENDYIIHKKYQCKFFAIQ